MTSHPCERNHALHCVSVQHFLVGAVHHHFHGPIPELAIMMGPGTLCKERDLTTCLWKTIVFLPKHNEGPKTLENL